MTLTTVGSGSSGNCYVLQDENEALVIEAGMNFALSHQWVSVEDRLPEPGQEVLLYNNNSIRRYEIGWLRKKKGDDKSRWALSNGFVEDDDITHWCAIPELNDEKE